MKREVCNLRGSSVVKLYHSGCIIVYIYMSKKVNDGEKRSPIIIAKPFA